MTDTILQLKRTEEVVDVLVDVDDLLLLARYSWRVHPLGYIQGRLKGAHLKTAHMHRVVMRAVLGREPIEVDHINGCKWDNRRTNLRECTHAENHQNRHHAQSTSTTGVRGVGWDSRRLQYVAEIKVAGRKKFLGRFRSLAEADAVVKAARARLMPFSAEARHGT